MERIGDHRFGQRVGERLAVGVTKDLPLERWYRELRIRRIGEGPSEVQRLIMARDILGGSCAPWAARWRAADRFK